MEKKQVFALFDTGARGVVTADALLRQSRNNRSSGREVEVVMVSDRVNTQMAEMCRFSFCIDKHTDPRKLVRLLKARGVSIAIVNAEKYFYFTRYLREAGIEIIGPVWPLNELTEGNKAWTVGFMERNGIPGLPRSKIFHGAGDVGAAIEFIETMREKGVAIKPAGQTGGKGVKVMGVQLSGIKSAIGYARELLDKGKVIVIQERLIGLEFSIHGMFDKKGNWAFGRVVYDNKHRLDSKFGDGAGPYTGSMGAFCDSDDGDKGNLKLLTNQQIAAAETVMLQTAQALKAETGIPYQGILYGQFIAVGNEIYLIEFNARFGDPEAFMLDLLDTESGADFATICEAIVKGNLNKTKICFRKRAMLLKYVVEKRYPDSSNGNEIEVKLKNVKLPENARILFGSMIKDGKPGLFKAKGRMFGVLVESENIPRAAREANKIIRAILGHNMMEVVDYRKGLGTSEHIELKRQLQNIS